MPQLIPGKDEAVVRMYRIGHGDCFLIALPGADSTTPYYIVIDCGYKPGSPKFIHKKKIGDIVDDLFEACGGRIDLFVITHEHQDHCNGIWKPTAPYFEKFTIANAWFAWTESPTDKLAIKLRKHHKDVLVGLVEARRQLALAASENDPAVQRLTSLLGLEWGGEDDTKTMPAAFAAAAKDPEASPNKQGMALVRRKALETGGDRAVSYLRPGECPTLPGLDSHRAYVLGPPENEDLLADEDPKGDEGFKRLSSLTFSAAVQSSGADAAASPFARKYHITKAQALEQDWFAQRYGGDDVTEDRTDKNEVAGDAPWRRIDEEWLYSAESLALKLNTGINNTSLVLAFELPKSKKILLFVGDAQRGNWISWDEKPCKVDGKKVTARDILARTVLYKVGHHGSHNATLAGTDDDTYPNLGWMAQGRAADEFTAMITAVNKWAMDQKPAWVHPLPSIRQALEVKTGGRIFQTDEKAPKKPADIPKAEWDRFLKRTQCEELHFTYTIHDK